MAREVRNLMVPDRFDHTTRKWLNKARPIVHLGDVGVWSMVRHAEHPQAMPFVISRKEWDASEIAA